MKSETSMKYYLGVKETNIRKINWRLLLRKYKNGSITIMEKYILKMYAEIYGILLED